jgi:hypothetical protein
MCWKEHSLLIGQNLSTLADQVVARLIKCALTKRQYQRCSVSQAIFHKLEVGTNPQNPVDYLEEIESTPSSPTRARALARQAIALTGVILVRPSPTAEGASTSATIAKNPPARNAFKRNGTIKMSMAVKASWLARPEQLGTSANVCSC